MLCISLSIHLNFHHRIYKYIHNRPHHLRGGAIFGKNLNPGLIRGLSRDKALLGIFLIEISQFSSFSSDILV